MGRIADIERAVWSMATGSSHFGYEQARWRLTRQPIESVKGWSDNFGPDPEAGGINRRAWKHVGVVAVRDHQLEKLVTRDNVDPAVAFKMGKRLVVGAIDDAHGFGHIYGFEGKRMGHGLRIGDGETQFSIGIIDSTGTFISPKQEYIDTQGPIHVDDIGDKRTAYTSMKFS